MDRWTGDVVADRNGGDGGGRGIAVADAPDHGFRTVQLFGGGAFEIALGRRDCRAVRHLPARDRGGGGGVDDERGADADRDATNTRPGDDAGGDDLVPVGAQGRRPVRVGSPFNPKPNTDAEVPNPYSRKYLRVRTIDEGGGAILDTVTEPTEGE